MLRAQVKESLQSLVTALESDPGLRDPLSAWWASNGREGGDALPKPLRTAATVVDRALPTLTRTSTAEKELAKLEDAGDEEEIKKRLKGLGYIS